MLGYHLEEHVVRASHFGVPQRRDRLFIIGTLRNRSIQLEPTAHEMPFGPCIEWGAPAKWRPVASATPRVRERVAAGRLRHGSRFLTQHVTGHKGIGLDQAIRTVTTKDQWAVVDGDRYRPLTVRENARAMGFPDTYAWPTATTRGDQIKGLGNAVCPPVAKHLVERVAASL
jgi:DNA (cytosine-5)-methyltransferase 1